MAAQRQVRRTARSDSQVRYRKHSDNPKQWIIDEEFASNVRRIFRLNVEGFGLAQIARILNEEHILNPSAYKFEKGILKKERKCSDPYFWNTTTIHKMLDSLEYLGYTVNFKIYSKSYKDKKCRWNPEDKWLIFLDAHPAIIDEATWDIVRKMRKHKRRSPRYGKSGLFSGSLYCSDCGNKLYHLTREIKTKTNVRYDGAYSCSVYRKQSQYQRKNGQGCTAHYIRETALEQLVLEELRELLSFISQYEKKFVHLVMDKSTKEQSREMKSRAC